MEKRSYSLQITGSELGEGTFLEQKTIFGQGLFRDLLSKVTKPTAASARSGLLTEAQRGRNQLWSLQPVPMTQRYPDVTSRGAVLQLALPMLNITGARMDPSVYPGMSAGSSCGCLPLVSYTSTTSWAPSLSQEGVKSKNSHETARGRALRTGWAPRPLSRAKSSNTGVRYARQAMVT